MSNRSNPSHVAGPGGGFSPPRVPGIPHLPPPTEEDEKLMVGMVLETADDRGIAPHLEAIGQVLGRWHHLIEPQPGAQPATRPTVAKRIPGTIRVIDDIRFKPELRHFPLPPPRTGPGKPTPTPTPTPGPRLRPIEAPLAAGVATPLRFTGSLKQHVIVDSLSPQQLRDLKTRTVVPGLRQESEPAAPEVEFDIEELFELPADADPGLVMQFRQQGLHRFFLLELEIEFRELKAQLGDGTEGRLNELKYRLQDGTQLKTVSLNLPFDGLFSSFSGGQTVPLQDEHAAWHLESIRATRPGPGVLDPQLPAHLTGQGIRIAHPDTGWTDHPELDAAGLDLASQFNVINPLRSAEEPLANAIRQGDVPTLSPHHGTATGSVIVSHDRADAQGVSDVLGVAPGARLVPIRCASHVILVSGVSLSRAILYSVVTGADVISMSLGGFGSRFLQSVLKLAILRHIIPVAAAGNAYPLVVCPAIYNETIGVAAVNRHDAKMTSGNARFISASGCGVDVAAPGAGVNRAYWSDELAPITGASDGTSYATAITAGAAAIWLQHHGKQALVSRLRLGETLVDVFRVHLKASARVPLGWDSGRMGAGILDVPNLLDDAPLDAHFGAVPNPLQLALIRPLMSAQDVVVKMLCPVLGTSEVLELLNRALGVGQAMVERMAEEIEQLLRTTREVVEAIGEAVTTHLRGVVHRLIDTLRDMAAAVTGQARAVLQAAIDKLEQGVDRVSAWNDNLSQLFDDALATIGNAVAQARDAIEQALERVKEKIEETLDQVAGTVRDAAEKLSDTLRGLVPV